MTRRTPDETNEGVTGEGRAREQVWRRPTRRAFVAMLGAAAAAFALEGKRRDVDPVEADRPKGMRWIGHC